ncbi:MAG: 2Fe-2S iron-sulfur cluster binding domain-containing protein [Sphingomonadales bacterium]|nr:2Fe-2S iron-sulfur cluster binding domain-containing protein [Sphingomonadales bacterium]
MVSVTFVAHDGTRRAIEAVAGLSLMEAAKAADVPGIEAVCGGNCYCGTCRVILSAAWLEKLGRGEDYERELIADTVGEAGAASRLSCQITVDAALEGLIVETPESQC